MILRWLCVLLGALTLLVSWQAGAAAAQKEQEEFVIARDGRPCAVIVVPAGVPIPVRFAAQELRTFLAQMTGAALEIVPNKPEKRGAIVLGENPLASAAGISLAGLRRDGFILSVRKDVAYIVGRDENKVRSQVLQGLAGFELGAKPVSLGRGAWYFERGTLNGTYRFLEELGVRWFFPGPKGTVVPQKKDLSLRCMEAREEPHFEMR